MRISTEKDDPGYISDGSFYRVFLNGSLISRVMTADTDQGFLKVLLIGKDGKIMIDIATKKPMCKYLFGMVEIRKIQD